MKKIYIGESQYKLIRTTNGIKVVKLVHPTEKGGAE